MMSFTKRLLTALITASFSMILVSCAYFSPSAATIKSGDVKNIPLLKIPPNLASNRIEKTNFLASQHYPAPPKKIDLTPPGLNK